MPQADVPEIVRAILYRLIKDLAPDDLEIILGRDMIDLEQANSIIIREEDGLVYVTALPPEVRVGKAISDEDAAKYKTWEAAMDDLKKATKPPRKLKTPVSKYVRDAHALSANEVRSLYEEYKEAIQQSSPVLYWPVSDKPSQE